MNEPRKRKHEHAGYLPDISLFRGARHASRTGGSWYSQRRFYPRDAKLVRLLAMALCLSVCLSVSATSRCSIGFGTAASFHRSYTVL